MPVRLHEFIRTHRDTIIARTRERVADRPAPAASETELAAGIPLFVDQLSAGLSAGTERGAADIAGAAAVHGGHLLDAGFTIGQVVHDYGSVCQSITELAVARGAPIGSDDFQTLNLCLDVAIAEAVGEYTRRREQQIAVEGTQQLGFLAHELRNLLNTATLAYHALLTGGVGVGGSTGAMLGRSLAGMRDLVSQSLADVRLDAAPPRREHVPVARLMEEIEIAATLQTSARAIHLVVERPHPDLHIEGDAQILAAIVTNLVQNALKFTRHSGHVSVTTRVTRERVMIDVADECGGLPPGKAEELFRPFSQRGADRSGLGLGLAISVKGADAMGAHLSVRDVPGTGCIFTIDLQRSPATLRA